MMNKLKAAGLAIVLGSASMFASAGGYIGLGYMSMGYEQPNVESATQENSTDPNVIIEQLDGGVRPERFSDIDDDLEGLKVKFGYQLNRYFAIEVRGGYGVSPITLEDYGEEIVTDFVQIAGVRRLEILTTPVDAELNLESYIGGYIRIGGDFENWFASPYVIWGHSRGNFDVTEAGGTAGAKLRNASYGAGINFKINDRVYINTEYMELFDRDEIEVKEISASIEFKL